MEIEEYAIKPRNPHNYSIQVTLSNTETKLET